MGIRLVCTTVYRVLWIVICVIQTWFLNGENAIIAIQITITTRMLTEGVQTVMMTNNAEEEDNEMAVY